MIVRTYDLTFYKDRKKLIKSVLKYYNITIKDLAEQIGLAGSSVNAFLCGNNNSADILGRIDKYLDEELSLIFVPHKQNYIQYEAIL